MGVWLMVLEGHVVWFSVKVIYVDFSLLTVVLRFRRHTLRRLRRACGLADAVFGPRAEGNMAVSSANALTSVSSNDRCIRGDTRSALGRIYSFNLRC